MRGGNKLVTQYDELMANVTYPWQGKNVTLSEMHGHCKNPDRSVRKAAFAVIGETLDGISEKLDGIYDKLVKVRTRMAKKMGFDNYVEMGDLRMDHVGFGRKEVAVSASPYCATSCPCCPSSKPNWRKSWASTACIFTTTTYTSRAAISTP